MSNNLRVHTPKNVNDDETYALIDEIDHLDGILFRDKYIEEYVYKDDKDDGNEARI